MLASRRKQGVERPAFRHGTQRRLPARVRNVLKSERSRRFRQRALWINPVRHLRNDPIRYIYLLEKFATRIQFAELEKATNDFNEANRIGKLGTMYKVSLPNGWILAVKRFNKSKRSEKKVQLRVGLARGLAWLHNNNNLRVVHQNISSECILLDNSFETKLSNFGEATIMSSNSTVSTLGSGETWVLGCDKKDVYGFGIVLLELVTREEPNKLILLCNNSGGTFGNFAGLYDAIDDCLGRDLKMRSLSSS
ncbi:hypothetical protein RJ639_032947 [Escallonia herrerae]|uniref:Protein kinase domain-containing protein n=1 Tax=Escallonia herrerae TaxID=1293975 RepID=A0AA88WYL6_9ASTE|nr:hypothetical protein RJ639_032947 [Escallonia herrerae]